MEGIYNIRDYGERSKNGTDWTGAFRAAVADALRAGGGIVYVPAGKYAAYSIRLASNITLYVAAGAELDFMEDTEGYEIVETEFEGISGEAYMPCIYALGAHHVAVKGDGVINGNGAVWWKQVRENTLKRPRPYLICFQECEHVRIEGVTLYNSPAWTVHPLYCRDVLIRGISIKNPSDSPNTDGINPDGCRDVSIINCRIDVGDDCITLKSGTEKTPIKRPCENIMIANCALLHGHGGIVIGSEMSGGVRNVTVTNCIFQDTDRGLRVKTRRRRGGVVENIHFNNVIMDRVMCPFVFNMYYFCGEDGKADYVRDKEARPVDGGTPCIRGIHISNVTVTNASASAGFIYGLKEMPVSGVTLSHVRITMDPDGAPGTPAMMDGITPVSAQGFYLRNVEKLTFDNVVIANARDGEILADDSVGWE